MKKIENIIEGCWHCRHCHRYVSVADEYIGEVRFCGHRDLCTRSDRDRLIQVVGDDSKAIPIPDWCPLETYAEAAQEPAPQSSAGTIILPGMPDLEWMTENLSGFGGTEIDGRWYYTWDEAMAAAEQLGNGWRLPTRSEMVDLGSTWDDERKGRWFGGNHDTDHKGSLFFPASGYRSYPSGALVLVGMAGNYWFSSPQSGRTGAGNLGFNSGIVNPLYSSYRAFGFTVRCVRNRQ